MFKHVIVGVDEHQGGRDATALANRLVESDGSVSCARVLVRDALIGRGASPDFDAAECRRAQERHAAAHAETGDEPQQLRCVPAPSVGRGLHELADAERADLLVVGSCQRGLVGRVMLGDDTSDALNGAPCALAIAPFGYAERPAALREVGVAYDGSPESEDALEAARAIATESGAKLSAFQAVSIPAYLTVPGALASGEAFPALVNEAIARIEALGGVEAHAAYGLPGEELAMYSASLDLLVVGSRGHGPIGRLMHGSTSRQLARNARCPVLVLTRGARAIARPDLDHVGQVAATAAVG
ncbi:MAG: universal stress protein [Solirubrobacteraceae bacterium]